MSDIGEKEEEETNAAIEEEKSEEKSDNDWEDEHDNCSAEDDLEHSSEEDGDEPEKTEYAVQDELQPETGNVPSVDVAPDEISDECEDLDWCPKDEDSSGEDDEAEEPRKHAKEVLRKIRMKLPLDEEKEVKESITQL